MGIAELKERVLESARELAPRFPENWVAVEFDCTVLEEDERPVFLWRGGWRRCIVLRQDDVNRSTVLLTPEGLFTARLSFTLSGAGIGERPDWRPNWKEREKAENLCWAACGPQAEIVLDILRLEDI